VPNNASDYLENKLVDHSLGTTTFTKPTAVHIALFTVTPTDVAASGTEVTGGSYARQTATFAAASGGSAALTAAVAFPAATADWGTVVAVGIFDAATTGNMLWWGPLTANRTVSNGTTYTQSTRTVAID